MNITVPVERAPKGAMYLRESWASGVYDGKEFTLDLNVDGRTVIFQMSGETYLLTTHDLGKALCELAAKGARE